MEFNQNNKYGQNKILFETNGGNFTDQSKQIREYIISKDRGQKNANIIAIIGILVGIAIAFVK